MSLHLAFGSIKPIHRRKLMTDAGRRLKRGFYVCAFMISAIVFFYSLPLQAQYQPPSTELSTYEEQRYGQKLWEIPREPYQSGFEQYKARDYIPPEDGLPAVNSLPPKRSSVVRPKKLQTDPGVLRRSDAGTKRRFQTEMKFREDQRKISERSRIAAPSVPSQNKIYGPGQSPALKNQ